MAKTFHLTVATVGNNLFDGDAVSVTLPGKDGVFQVLEGHEALVSQLALGTIRILTPEGTTESVVVEKEGVAEISGHQTTVLL